jgi:hypothetical protein
MVYTASGNGSRFASVPSSAVGGEDELTDIEDHEKSATESVSAGRTVIAASASRTEASFHNRGRTQTERLKRKFRAMEFAVGLIAALA